MVIDESVIYLKKFSYDEGLSMAKYLEEATLDEIFAEVDRRTECCVVVFSAKYPDSPSKYALKVFGEELTARGLIEYARDLIKYAMKKTIQDDPR